MSNSIKKNNITILRCANWLTQLYFEKLSIVVEEEGLKNNTILAKFLEQLDQNMWGYGMVMVEITEYFNGNEDKLPLKLFYDLTTKAIDKIKQEDLGEFKDNYIKLLDDFIKKIL